MLNEQKNWSHVTFVSIFGDLYQIKQCDISNNYNQFTHLRSASGMNSDIIKMVAVVLLIRMYIEVSKQDKVFI